MQILNFSRMFANFAPNMLFYFTLYPEPGAARGGPGVAGARRPARGDVRRRPGEAPGGDWRAAPGRESAFNILTTLRLSFAKKTNLGNCFANLVIFSAKIQTFSAASAPLFATKFYQTLH